MEKTHENMCFDVVVLYENIQTCLFTYVCFPVFSPFSAHFYPPLHHNGKGSIASAECINVDFFPREKKHYQLLHGLSASPSLGPCTNIFLRPLPYVSLYGHTWRRFICTSINP